MWAPVCRRHWLPWLWVLRPLAGAQSDEHRPQATVGLVRATYIQETIREVFGDESAEYDTYRYYIIRSRPMTMMVTRYSHLQPYRWTAASDPARPWKLIRG